MDDDKILNTSEICEKLRIKPTTFYNKKLEILTQFGLFNDGRYKMFERDLNKYLESLRSAV